MAAPRVVWVGVVAMSVIAVGAVVAFLLAAPGGSSGQQPKGEPVQEPPVKVRSSILAGTWYPASSKELQETLDALLDKAQPPKLEGHVVGLIVPHAGYPFSGLAAAHGFKVLKQGDVQTVVLMGPSHTAAFEGCLIAQVDAYETPLGKVPLDKEACQKLLRHRLFRADEIVHQREHCLEIELPFLQRRLGKFKLVPLLFGALAAGDYEEAAKAIRECAPAGALYVASSDFTHYGPRYDYVPFEKDVKENLEKLDGEARDLLAARDFDGFQRYLRRTGATICGHVPIGVLLKLLPADAKGTLLKYSTSGEVTRDWTNSVSYVALAFSSAAKGEEGALTVEEQTTLLRLARDTLEGFVRTGKLPEGSAERYALTAALREKGAAFVTLTIGGELRGCIGSLVAVEPLYLSVRRHAVNASQDPRFPAPVSPEELPRIQIEISVLSKPVKVDSLEQVVIGKHGLILEKAGRSAVFLPQVAPEQGWGREEMAGHLCQKAGLPADAWKEGATLRVFTAQVFNEKEVLRAAEAR